MEDLGEVINRKIWTAEQLLTQVEDMAAKAKALSPGERMEISVAVDDWAQDRVERRIEVIREAVLYPIRHKNKKKLEGMGVNTERITQDVFDDTDRVQGIAVFLGKIGAVSEKLTEILASEHVIERWLRDDPDEIEQKLQDILDGQSSLQEILDLDDKIDEKFRYLLLKKSIEDTCFIEKTEEITSNVNHISSLGVLLGNNIEFEEMCEMIGTLRCTISDLADNYGISGDDIRQEMDGTTISEACKIILQLEKECAEKKRRLLEEWKTYAHALESMGKEISEAREALKELEKQVSNMRERCLEHLGDAGFGLLKFLRSEEEFPKNIEMEEIEKALVILRPLFLRGLRETEED